jgi:hypothetical protein
VGDLLTGWIGRRRDGGGSNAGLGALLQGGLGVFFVFHGHVVTVRL